MRGMFLLPIVLVGLAGCIHAETTAPPPRAATTVVTPGQGPTNSTTVVRSP
jgi:hypothetical protein